MNGFPEDKQKQNQTDSADELLLLNDTRSLEEWLTHYRPLLRAIVEAEIDSSLRAKMDPSDVVQEACVEVAKSIDQIHAIQGLRQLAYVRQIIMSKLKEARRRFLVSQKRDVGRESNSESERLDDVVSNQDDQLDAIINEELLERTRVAMVGLPLEVKKIIHMRFMRNMTYVEIGRRVRRSDDDVRMLLKRWLSRVRMEVLPISSSNQS